MGRLGQSLVRQRRFRDAETLLVEGHAVLNDQPDSDRSVGRTRRALRRIIDLYDAWGKPEKATEWRAKLPTVQDAVTSDSPADKKQDE